MDNIKIGFRKSDAIHLAQECQGVARTFSQVQSTAKQLGVNVTFAKLIEWQGNPESLKEAYRGITLKGVDNLPPSLAKQARETTEAEIDRVFGAVDWYGSGSQIKACLPFIEWDEKTQCVRVNTDKVNEACTNFVTEETKHIYNDLQSLCEHLNKVTKGTCADDYVTEDAPIKCEGGVWAINGDRPAKGHTPQKRKTKIKSFV